MSSVISSLISEADMKKILLAVIILLSAFNIFSSASFGYSLAPVGAMTPTGNYGALTISAIFSPYKETHIGDMELAIDLSPVYPFFESARARIQSPVFLLLHHPFSWMFHNSVIWSPLLSFGAEYRLRNEWSITMGLSPFAFQNTHFIYEFFSPYAIYSITSDKWGWEMYIMRFSYFF